MKMARVGLEPTRLAAQDPKSCVAANYTTGPNQFFTKFQSSSFFGLSLLHALRHRLPAILK